MPRRRLTTQGLFGRTAAPDESSGRNPNVPIRLYDTKPNARFSVGSEVTYLDSKLMKVRGTVLGHVAEDRVLVQWPNEVMQEDVEDLVGLHEIENSGMGPMPNDPLAADRVSRNASLLTFEDIQQHIPDHPVRRDAEIIIEHDSEERPKPGTGRFFTRTELAERGAALTEMPEAIRLRAQDDFDEEDGLEYIPDQPNFLDGDPVNDEHPGELPSEQDPRDKIEEVPSDHSDCESFELMVELPDLDDLTDLIENGLTASRRAALFGKGKGKQGQPPILQTLLQMKDDKGNPLYSSEADASLKYNLFDDPGVVQTLQTYGLHDSEIKTFADIRQHQLDRAREKAYKNQPVSPYGYQESPEHKWGQGTGIRYNIKQKQQQQQTSMDEVWPALQQWLQKMTDKSLNEGGLNPRELDAWKLVKGWQNKPTPENQAAALAWYNKIKAHHQQRSQKASASRPVDRLRHRADFVNEFLAMPRTAAVIRQAADVAEALQDVDTGGELDETTKKAARYATQDLLIALTHLRGSNNRVANMVAPQIEQAFLDSLSH